MKCPAELYTASTRRYDGLPELTYPFHERDILVAACGRLCLHRKKINISTVLAGQKLGIKEVDDGIWLASFMHYDPGYFDLEQKTLQPMRRAPMPVSAISKTSSASWARRRRRSSQGSTRRPASTMSVVAHRRMWTC